MGGPDDHSKPELSTLLESGTFYFALTEENAARKMLRECCGCGKLEDRKGAVPKIDKFEIERCSRRRRTSRPARGATAAAAVAWTMVNRSTSWDLLFCILIKRHG